jgi:nucleoid DNA-binding protein
MPRSAHRNEIDRRVARELGVARKTVSRITTEFLEQLSQLMAESGRVTIEGFGAFRVDRIKPAHPRTARLTKGVFKKGERGGSMSVEVSSYVRVHFSKSRKLKQLLDEAFKE